mmetsp:Transcript_17593/g.15506  ORF Transcript_17593/g.15506 Transcript_17593/m.15506 type:complete len:486 (+) Transcript_17593:14-1471(+)
MASKINIKYLGLWMTVISLGMFQFGYGMGMFNNFVPIMFKIYENSNANVIADSETFNSVVTTSVPLGAAIGSFTGGLLTSIGRRNGAFVASVIIAVGAGVTMVFNFYALIIGRLILGYGCGAFSVISPLFISETSPVEVAGAMGALNQFMVTFGIMISYFFGFLAPIKYIKGQEDNIDPAIFTTQSWRIVFIIPAFIALFQTIMLLLVFKHDTPTYYKQKGRKDLIEQIDKLIYKEKDSEINTSVSMLSNGDNGKVPISQLCGPMYRKAFVLVCTLALFSQLTGINLVIFYSSTIFTKGRDEGYESEMAGRIGTVIVGVVNWACSLFVIYLLSKFGRKTLMIVGHLGMISSLLILAIMSIIGFSTGIIIFTLVFIAFFEFGIGPILWLYAAEVMTDSGMAFASFISWCGTIFFSLLTQQLFNWLTVKGTYFMLFGINAVGLLFIIIFIKETKDKTKEQLASLYSKYKNLDQNESKEDEEDDEFTE